MRVRPAVARKQVRAVMALKLSNRRCLPSIETGGEATGAD
jgi:hypothetical protein